MDFKPLGPGERVTQEGTTVRADDPGEVSPRGGRMAQRRGVTPEEAEIIRALFQVNCAATREGWQITPKILEIGTGIGTSGRAIAERFQLYTVDIDSWVEQNVWTLLRDYAGVAAPPRFAKSPDEFGPTRFQGAFIDGDHSHAAARRDIIDAAGRLDYGSLLICHDYYLEGVKRAVDELSADPAFRMTLLTVVPTRCQLAVFAFTGTTNGAPR